MSPVLSPPPCLPSFSSLPLVSSPSLCGSPSLPPSHVCTGIWDKTTGMLGATGRDQVTSVVVLYGPRTTALVCCDDGVYEFTCGEGDKWFASREKIQIKPVFPLCPPSSPFAVWAVRTIQTPAASTKERCREGKGLYSSPCAVPGRPCLVKHVQAALLCRLVHNFVGFSLHRTGCCRS